MYGSNLYKHILNRHLELSELDVDTINYVDYVVNNFDEIRKGTANSFLLVAPEFFIHKETGQRQKSRNVAAIVLHENHIVDDNFEYTYWEVKTAQSRRKKAIEKLELVWTKNQKGT